MIRTSVSGSIITYTGRLFWPLDPDMDDINLLDICHALGNQCRFTGHCNEFYSVAQHSCLVHDILPPNLRLAGLLHDASEAYLMDLAKPVKTQSEMDFFRGAEDLLMKVIASKYGLDYPFDPMVKTADKILVNTEYRDLMPKHEAKTHEFNSVEPLSYRINPWSSAESKYGMIDRFEKLGIEVRR